MESATRRAQSIRHGERSVAIHACGFGLMDCRATLAVTKFKLVFAATTFK
jgi:hypothetical protein